MGRARKYPLLQVQVDAPNAELVVIMASNKVATWLRKVKRSLETVERQTIRKKVGGKYWGRWVTVTKTTRATANIKIKITRYDG